MDVPSAGSQPQVPVTPSPAMQPPPATPPANTSGQGSMAVVPPEIKGWNWGAFLLNWIWGIGNRTYMALLCFVPLVNVVMIFVLGVKGNEWAWRNKRWESVDAFKRTQRKWAWAGLIIVCMSIIPIVFALILVLSSNNSGSNTPTDFPVTAVTPSSTAPATVQAESFDFLGTHFVFGDNLSTGTQDYYEFLPEGQTFDNWQSMVTLVRDNSRIATLSDADQIAQSTLDNFKNEGAFVYNSFTATSSAQQNPVNAMTVVFTQTGKAEVDLKKIFLSDANWIISDTYAVTITASSSAELTQKVNDFLGTTKDIGPVFINTGFPAPWNL